MAVTILKIAERLQLSHSTVSRVLNNKPNTYISEDTRKRVLRVAQEMGYRPNLAARSLRDARTNMIGVFGSPEAGVWGGIGPEITRGLSRILHARRFDMFVAFDAKDARENGIPAWRFDGAVVLQMPSQPIVEHLRTCGQPYVAVNEKMQGTVCVLCDDVGGTQTAMEHLWSLGHRRIAYANALPDYMPHYSVPERQESYAAFLQERGVELSSGYDQRISVPDRRNWLRQVTLIEGATAILAYDHVVAVDLLSAAYELRLRVPEDVSLICFNDEWPVARTAPPLTVIAPSGEEMGRKAGELLLNLLDEPTTASDTTLRINQQLVVRNSTAPLTR